MKEFIRKTVERYGLHAVLPPTCRAYAKWVLALLAWTFSASGAFSQDLASWLKAQEATAKRDMLESTIRTDDGAATFVASISSSHPQYHFHWVRDAAGVMRSILNLYETAKTPEERSKYFDIFQHYANFSRKIQTAPNPSGGVGEPKFYPDGSPFVGPWARPQSDGPASRAIVMISWARVLLAEGRFEEMEELLYDSTLPTRSVIKTDLEYIANNWRAPSYDLWEEVKGDHFYTRMMERRALLDGAALAAQLGDPAAASWYVHEAREIEQELQHFWDDGKKVIIPFRHPVAGATGRDSGLDSSVVLGVLLGHTFDGFLDFSNDQVLSTVSALERRFKALYPINQNPQIPGIAIGRYPEDRYDGHSTASTGNPWVTMTATFSQFYVRLARLYERQGAIVISPLGQNFFDDLLASVQESPLPQGLYQRGSPEFVRLVQAMRRKGDSFLERIRYHTGPDGELSEQINRDTGYMQGAEHLSLSYATFLWASWARKGEFPTVSMPGNP